MDRLAAAGGLGLGYIHPKDHQNQQNPNLTQSGNTHSSNLISEGENEEIKRRWGKVVGGP